MKSKTHKPRKSGIELLKICAMLMIVIFHTSVTLNSPSIIYSSTHYWLNWNYATTNIQNFLMALITNFVPLGNTIFFVCSAWFLCKSKTNHKIKILYMLLDIWLISFIWLIIIISIGIHPRIGDIIKELLPTTFCNNWYLTAYIIFYLTYPALNWIIKKLTQRQHLLMVVITFVMYFAIAWVKEDLFFPSVLIFWLVIYFIISYIRTYLNKTFSNTRFLFLLLLIGLLGLIFTNLIVNFLGLHFILFSNKAIEWSKVFNNPFALMATIAIVALAYKNKTWVSKPINYISSLTLLIYIIHDNLLFGVYVRPLVFIWIKKTLGYKYILLYDLILGVLLFLIAIVLSMLYKTLLQHRVHELINKIYPQFKSIVNSLLDYVMQLH